MNVNEKIREGWLEYNAERQYQMNKMWADKYMSLEQKQAISARFKEFKYDNIDQFKADYSIYAEINGKNIGVGVKQFARMQAKYATRIYEQTEVDKHKSVFDAIGVDVSKSEIKYGLADIARASDTALNKKFFDEVQKRYNASGSSQGYNVWVSQNMFGS